jgi:U3 small nucleolar RNA-associated protein 19
MIQRLDASSQDSVDPYNPADPSPLTSKAIESSCWELKTLQGHYLSSVATLAKIFGEAFTKPEYNLEDFLDHGYGTVSFLFALCHSGDRLMVYASYSIRRWVGN